MKSVACVLNGRRGRLLDAPGILAARERWPIVLRRKDGCPLILANQFMPSLVVFATDRLGNPVDSNPAVLSLS